MAGGGIVGAKLAAGGGAYGFVAPLAGLSYMLVGTVCGAAHAGGEPHAGVATFGVVAMFASCCACCPTVVCRAVISEAMLEFFLFNSMMLVLDAWVMLARLLFSVVMLSLSFFSYELAAPWYKLPPIRSKWGSGW